MKKSPCLLIASLLTAALAAAGPWASAPPEKPVTPESGFVTTPDGTKIHYIEEGKGPAILFVPGWMMPGWIWENQIVHFAKTNRAVAMDPRSQGESTQTGEGLYPGARARDIRTVVEQLKLAPVVLVGWSMGADEVAGYVDQFGTDDVKGLVFVDGRAERDNDPEKLAKTWQWIPEFQKDRGKWTEDWIHSSFLFKKKQPEEYLKRVGDAMQRTPTDSAIAIWAGYFTSGDYRVALSKIDKPMLIIMAAGGLCSGICEDMQKRIRGSQLAVMDNVGHAVFVDDPDGFNSLLENFTARLER